MGQPSHDDDLRRRAFLEIAAHLKIYGPREWDRVAARFPEVTKRTFFRWVKAVREPPEQNDGPGKPVMMDEETAEEMRNDAARRARLAAHKNIPAAPSPAYMARNGARADRNIDFLAAINDVWDDVLMLRDFAMSDDPNNPGHRKIKNPGLFDTSIKRRLDAMAAALKVMQEIWDLQYQQRFYDEITAILVEELAVHPDVQNRVIERLSALNQRRGMTVYADAYD